MLPRPTSIALALTLLSACPAVPVAAIPLAASSGGTAQAPRRFAIGNALETGSECVLEAARNTAFNEQGKVYYFSCQGDEIARFVEFNSCVTNSACTSWYPKTATVSFWISACNGLYPFTTSSFEAQVAIYPVDPWNPTPDVPRPAQEPLTSSPVFTVPAFTRTSPSGADALVTVDLPLYGQCLHSGPFYLVFRWVSVRPEDDACSGACAERLPGLVSKGACLTPECSDPLDTHLPNATFWRNLSQGYNWIDASVIGVLSDISMSLNIACCDAIDVRHSTWGKIKSLGER